MAAICWLLSVGCYLIAATCWLMAVGCYLLAADLLTFGWLLALAAGCLLLDADYWRALAFAAFFTFPTGAAAGSPICPASWCCWLVAAAALWAVGCCWLLTAGC